MTVETRWSGLTVTDWLEGAVPSDAAGDGTSRARAATARRSSGCSRAPASRVSSSRRGPSSARCRSGSSRSATGCSCSAPTSRSCCSRRAWSGTSSTTAATTRRAPWSTSRPPAAGRARAALRLRERQPAPGVDRRPPGARRAAVARLGGEPAAAEHGAEGGAAQRTDAARAVPRADRLDPRRGDDLAARGARRRAQLGLPLLLAARRRDVRARARRPRLADGGRGAPALGGRVHRPHRRPPRAAAPALHRRRARARARRR